MGVFSKKKQIDELHLCEGVRISEIFYDQKENRLLSLMLKGFLVYLLSMGSIGFYLSAFDISFNLLMVHGIVFIMAFLCAGLYYRLFTENMGYLILLLVFGLFVYRYRIIINSGFYAIVNITVENASQYFDVDVQRLYTEQVENRYLTVTMVSIFIGIVLDIILNVYISRRMQYATAIGLTMFLNFIPLYLEKEPDMIYSFMLLGGISIALVLKAGKHYSPQIAIKRDDICYKSDKKGNFSYVYDVKTLAQSAIIVFCVVVVFIAGITRIKPKETFNVGYKPTKYKELTMAAMETFLVDGWSGFFRTNTNVGGMNGGSLGDVSSVRLDHMTDLVVELAPYNYDTVYLRNFTGVTYHPFENYWSSISEKTPKARNITPEANSLKEAYEAGEDYTAKAKIFVKNVGGYEGEGYTPYYYKSMRAGDYGFVEIEYYPRDSKNETYVDWDEYGDNLPYTEDDLYIDQANYDVIADWMEELPKKASLDDLTESLRNYFQDNIPYTVRPGKVPRKQDFINYFLTEGRKGYCSYFASSAVMAYRFMGFPARYVEGYAISYNQILDGDIVDSVKYSDVYEGYSELGETALVKVNVTDADAHAWVEVYDRGRGWFVVDVTPSAGEEEDVEDFWDSFDRIMNSGNETDNFSDGENALAISDELVDRVLLTILFVFCGMVGILIVISGRKYVIFAVRYKKAGLNDKLVMLYSIYRRRMTKKDKRMLTLINYQDQVDFLFDNYESKKGIAYDKNIIIDILQRAGFSNAIITEHDFQTVRNWMSDFKNKCGGKI